MAQEHAEVESIRRLLARYDRIERLREQTLARLLDAAAQRRWN
jgi:hypothetical protein